MVPIPKFTDQLLLEFKKDQHAKGMYVIDINPINIFHRIMIFRTGYDVPKRIYVFLFSTGATFVYMFMIAFRSGVVQMWYHDWPHIIGSGCSFNSWLKIWLMTENMTHDWKYLVQISQNPLFLPLNTSVLAMYIYVWMALFEMVD